MIFLRQVDGYYGTYGDYCAKCPVGSVCRSSEKRPTIEAPYAKAKFWRNELSLKEGVGDGGCRARGGLTSEGTPDGACDAEFAEIGAQCPEERWNFDKFPAARRHDRCYEFLGCAPKEICLGNNQCAGGYVLLKKIQDTVDAGVWVSRDSNDRSFSFTSYYLIISRRYSYTKFTCRATRASSPGQSLMEDAATYSVDEPNLFGEPLDKNLEPTGKVRGLKDSSGNDVLGSECDPARFL